MQVCEAYASQPNADAATVADLWMQALTYFRDLEAPNDQIYLEKALAVMTS